MTTKTQEKPDGLKLFHHMRADLGKVHIPGDASLLNAEQRGAVMLFMECCDCFVTLCDKYPLPKVEVPS